MGGRDSPRPTIPQADETWTTVARGPKNVSVDPKKFQNIKVSRITCLLCALMTYSSQASCVS